MSCDWLKNEHIKIANSVLKKLETIHIPKNAAMVFDIDHTLLDQHGGPIEPIVYLFHFVKQKGIQPVIITARLGHEKNIEWTKNQLKKHNLGGDNISMYFLPPDKTDPWRYKYHARKNVHERGLTVIMSIGDEQWDIGEYGGIGFKLPKCMCG